MYEGAWSLGLHDTGTGAHGRTMATTRRGGPGDTFLVSQRRRKSRRLRRRESIFTSTKVELLPLPVVDLILQMGAPAVTCWRVAENRWPARMCSMVTRTCSPRAAELARLWVRLSGNLPIESPVLLPAEPLDDARMRAALSLWQWLERLPKPDATTRTAKVNPLMRTIAVNWMWEIYHDMIRRTAQDIGPELLLTGVALFDQCLTCVRSVDKNTLQLLAYCALQVAGQTVYSQFLTDAFGEWVTARTFTVGQVASMRGLVQKTTASLGVVATPMHCMRAINMILRQRGDQMRLVMRYVWPTVAIGTSLDPGELVAGYVVAARMTNMARAPTVTQRVTRSAARSARLAEHLWPRDLQEVTGVPLRAAASAALEMIHKHHEFDHLNDEQVRDYCREAMSIRPINTDDPRYLWLRAVSTK